MNKKLTVKKTIEINAPISKVWNALSNPELIKQYLFGTETLSNWKVGSEIIFQGEYRGAKYRDKGKITKIEHEKLFQYTYWSGFSGLEDNEENYSLVTYELSEKNGKTLLSVTQQGFASEQAEGHSENSWKMVLNSLKKLLER